MQESIHIYLFTCDADQQVRNGSTSWIDALQRFLELSLMQLSGGNVYFHQINSMQEVEQDTTQQHSVVVPVISASLIASSVNIEELSSVPMPIFKVVKNPVEQHTLPFSIAKLLSYNFFYFDPDTGGIEEYEQFSLLDSSNAFWGTLIDLSYDILESVMPNEARMVDLGKGACIYLAETETHLQPQRRLVRRELRRYGYRVLPEKELDANIEKMEEEVNEALEKSIFSLHLMSEHRGRIIANSDTTLEEAQLEWSYEHTQNTNHHYQRLIWLPPNMEVEDERQSRMLKTLREQADETKGMEMVQVKLEDFKSLLLKQLAIQVQRMANLQNSSKIESNLEQEKIFNLYCVVEEKDKTVALPLVEWWEEQGATVNWIGSDSQANHRQRHIHYLNQCDACIIVTSHASDAWVVTKLQDILKSPGLGRKTRVKPLSALAVLPSGNHRALQETLNRYAQYSFVELWMIEKTLPTAQLISFKEKVFDAI